jgi:hypothetical protein
MNTDNKTAALEWFKKMDDLTFQQYALKYEHLIGADRLVTPEIKEQIYKIAVLGNKTPLWKQLNEARTQGEWQIYTERNNSLTIQTNSFNYSGNDIFSLNMSNDHCEANAAYTVLCVNNLHHLAEALEELNNAISGDVFNDDDKTERLMAARQKAKQALNRIS